MKLLLTPGYGGDLSKEELRYIKAALKASPALRRRWGFRSSRINDQAIRKVAREGVPYAWKYPQATPGGLEAYLEKKGTD